MGEVVEKKEKKKKGRPSLIDLQKRSIKEQRLQPQQKQNSNPYSNPNYRNSNPATPTPILRSTRWHPDPDLISPSEADSAAGEEEDDDNQSSSKPREKELKLVLQLPLQQHSSLNLYGSDSNAEDNDHKKRKINSIGDESLRADSEKEDKPIPGSKVDGGPSTPLPDKKLLMFILDRLQKKDTYGVFSEPVDPKELPDYHEIIEHPMDFATVKQKLAGGNYAYLEQFERDVFLISSNAMQYNAPDTIYFRQARSIQELAKKNFENLSNEPGLKIVRRGRPPTKHLKTPLGRPSLERAGSEFSDATLATRGEDTNWSSYDLRKGPLLLEKSGPPDSSGQSIHGSRSSEAYTARSTEHKFERNEEFTGSMFDGVKHVKKQFAPDESRRNTYRRYRPSAGVRKRSVLATFDGEKKMLLASPYEWVMDPPLNVAGIFSAKYFLKPIAISSSVVLLLMVIYPETDIRSQIEKVGLHSEHGYARSLGRFAANLGPVAWKIASNKIEKSLPAGIKFGPGWVGENEGASQRSMPIASAPSDQLSPSESFSLTRNATSATTSAPEPKSEKLFEKPEGDNSLEKQVPSTLTSLDSHPSKPLPPYAASLSTQFVSNKSRETSAESARAVRGLNSITGLNIPNSSVGVIRPRPPLQNHHDPMIRPGMNGFNGANGLNLSPQMGKLIGAARPTGFKFQAPQMPDTISRTNTNIVNPGTSNSLHLEDPKLSENPSIINSDSSLAKSGCEGSAAASLGIHEQPSWEGLRPQQKPDLVPPDLNIRFQSPGSPSCSRVKTMQPDLAMQL